MSIQDDAQITVSVISHGQAAWIEGLLDDLERLATPVAVMLTINRPEPLADDLIQRAGVQCLHNPHPQGFGANHNQAFRHCQTPWFGILNPDIRLPTDPFPGLLQAAPAGLGAIAPLMVTPDGAREDNARHFPTLPGLIRKALGHDDGRVRLSGQSVQAVDWVGGMFLLTPAAAFSAVGGFDEGFHLYYEDVDLCARLWGAGYRVELLTTERVVHHAQRASRRQLRPLGWHLRSGTRYFLKHTGRLPRTAGAMHS